MSAPKPRNEPSWCRGERHDEARDGAHRSEELSAGAPSRFNGGGEVTVWLEAVDGGPVRVAVNAANMTSATVEVTVWEARRLRDNLDRLLQAAAQASDAV